MEALKLEQNPYTYADYAKWETNERYELVDGVPYMMAAPTTEHQDITGDVFHQLKNILSGKPCKPYISPVDVCLSGKRENDKTVVQPDILVVCDRSKIEKNFINGAPEFVIEVLSPSNRSEVFVLKLKRYLMFGVKELWTIDPSDKSVSIFLLKNNKFEMTNIQNPINVPVSILDNCEINVQAAFAAANITYADMDEEKN